MGKNGTSLLKFAHPSDLIAVLVIIIGLLIAFFVDELAVRLIGMSISVLGGVSLVMLIGQRKSDLVESIYVNKITPDAEPKLEHVSAVMPEHEAKAEEKPKKEKQQQEKPLSKPAERTDIEKDGFRIVAKPQAGKEAAGNGDIYVSDSMIGASPATVDEMEEEGEAAIETTANAAVPEKESREMENPKADIGQPAGVNRAAGAGAAAISRPNPEAAGPQTDDGKSNLTKESAPGYIRKELDVPLSLLMEDTSQIGQEPKKEFEYFINKILTVIESVLHTKTAAFVLANNEKHELVTESHVTNVPEMWAGKKVIKTGKDILSRILEKGKPEVLTGITPAAEAELLPFYSTPSGTKSFVGVPVFYDKTVIGILWADSSESDAFDAGTVAFFGNFTRIITSLVKSYTEKYDLVQASKTLEAINLFRNLSSRRNYSVDDIAEVIVDTISKLFDATTAGFCGYDPVENQWSIRAIISKSDKVNGLRGELVDLSGAMIGKSVMSNLTIFINKFDKQEVRVCEGEEEIAGGYFMSVPVKSFNNTYGAVFVEGKNSSAVTQFDIGTLETLGNCAGSSIEKLHLIEIIQTSALIDHATGLLNTPAFQRRLGEEIARAADFKQQSTLCFIQIDKYASLDPTIYPERNEKMVYHIIGLLQNQLKKYDLLGRIDEAKLGVFLSGTKLDDARFWAERVRNKIAGGVVEIDGQRFSVTASFGLAKTADGINLETLAANAQHALDNSIQKTNSVSLYN